MNLLAMKDLREFAVSLAETLPEELYNQNLYELYSDYKHPKCSCFDSHLMVSAGRKIDKEELGISLTKLFYLIDTTWGIKIQAKKLELPIPTSFTAWDVVDRIDNLIDRENNL